jgi:hypothetical protein
MEAFPKVFLVFFDRGDMYTRFSCHDVTLFIALDTCESFALEIDLEHGTSHFTA